jgi:hypothetical protein
MPSADTEWPLHWCCSVSYLVLQGNDPVVRNHRCIDLPWNNEEKKAINKNEDGSK